MFCYFMNEKYKGERICSVLENSSKQAKFGTNSICTKSHFLISDVIVFWFTDGDIYYQQYDKPYARVYIDIEKFTEDIV